MLAGWDTSRTDALVAKYESTRMEREASKAAKKHQEVRSAQDEVDAAADAHEKAQKELKKSRMVIPVCCSTAQSPSRNAPNFSFVLNCKSPLCA